jgi:hypothetical protein
MTEISTTKINNDGTYSNYFQIGENGITFHQGNNNPNNLTIVPSPKTGDIYINKSEAEVYIYNSNVWDAISSSSSNGFYTQNITSSGVIIGNNITYIDTLFVTVDIASISSLLLPQNATSGTTFIVKDISGNASLYPIYISTQNNSLIDSSQNVVIDINYGCYIFLFNGNNWTVVTGVSSYPLNQLTLGGNFSSNISFDAIQNVNSYKNNYENYQYFQNISVNQTLAIIPFSDTIFFQENNFGVATCLNAPSSEVIIAMKINGTFFGSLVFAAGETTGSFVNLDTTIHPNDILIFSVSLSDSSIYGISITLKGSALYQENIINPYISISTNTNSIQQSTNFSVFGTVYPTNSNVLIGYSESSTMLPSFINNTLVPNFINGSYSSNLSISTSGTYYVWAEISNSTYTANTEIVITEPLITITSYPTLIIGTIGANISVSGTTANVNDQILVTVSSSNDPTNFNQLLAEGLQDSGTLGNWTASAVNFFATETGVAYIIAYDYTVLYNTGSYISAFVQTEIIGNVFYISYENISYNNPFNQSTLNRNIINLCQLYSVSSYVAPLNDLSVEFSTTPDLTGILSSSQVIFATPENSQNQTNVFITPTVPGTYYFVVWQTSNPSNFLASTTQITISEYDQNNLPIVSITNQSGIVTNPYPIEQNVVAGGTGNLVGINFTPPYPAGVGTIYFCPTSTQITNYNITQSNLLLNVYWTNNPYSTGTPLEPVIDNSTVFLCATSNTSSSLYSFLLNCNNLTSQGYIIAQTAASISPPPYTGTWYLSYWLDCISLNQNIGYCIFNPFTSTATPTSISITNTNNIFNLNVPFTITATTTPAAVTNVQMGISTSSTIPPTYTSTSSSNLVYSDTFTISTAGTYYAWAQITNTNINTNYEIIINSVPNVSIIQYALDISPSDSTATLPNIPIPGNYLLALCASWINLGANTGWNQLNAETSYSEDYIGIFYRQVVSGDTTGPYVPLSANNDGAIVGLYELNFLSSTFTFDQVCYQGDVTPNGGSINVGSGSTSTSSNSLQLGMLLGQQETTLGTTIPQFDNSWTSDSTAGPSSGGSDLNCSANIGHRTLMGVGASLNTTVTYAKTTSNGLAYISLNFPL